MCSFSLSPHFGMMTWFSQWESRKNTSRKAEAPLVFRPTMRSRNAGVANGDVFREVCGRGECGRGECGRDKTDRAERAMGLRVAEVYSSVQGEGRLTGTPSVFVRTSGCNLRCAFCDTRFASWEPEGDDWSVERLLERVRIAPEQHVVVTGGEPLLFPEMVEFSERLRELGRHVTFETAGTLHLPVFCDLMSISPKLSNSRPSAGLSPQAQARHEAARHQPLVMERLTRDYDYQLKFVVATPIDAQEVLEYLAEFPQLDRDRVLLMPEGTDCERLRQIALWLEPFCLTQGIRFCPRRHIEWFGNRRGS